MIRRHDREFGDAASFIEADIDSKLWPPASLAFTNRAWRILRGSSTLSQ
jgi:hypothetical protein